MMLDTKHNGSITRTYKMIFFSVSCTSHTSFKRKEKATASAANTALQPLNLLPTVDDFRAQSCSVIME